MPKAVKTEVEEIEIETESQQEHDHDETSQELAPVDKGGRRPGSQISCSLTEKRLEQLVSAIETGCSISAACDIVGIDSGYLYRRMKRDLAVDRAVKRAHAQAELHHMAKIRAGGQGWQASGWFLERARGYTVDKKPETNQKESQPVQVQLVVVFGQGEAKERRKVRQHLKVAEQSAKVIDV